MKKSYLADSVLLFVTFVWGIMFVFVKEAVDVMSPLAHLAARFAVAAVVIWPVWRVSARGRAVTGLDWRRGSILGFWLSGGFMLQTLGLQLTTASKAGFITGLCVVLVPLFGALFLSQRLTRPMLLGLAVAFAGLALLTVRGTEPLQAGDLLVLGGSVCYAIHILLTGRYTADHPPLLLASIQLTVVALLNVAGSLLFEPWAQWASSDIWTNLHVLRAIVLGAVFASAFAFWAQTYFQRYTSAVHTALIFSMEPVFAAGAAVVLGGESLSVLTVAGGAMILAGILITELRG